MNTSVKGILIKNSTSKPIRIHRNMRLGYLQELGTKQTLVVSTFLGITEQDLAAMTEQLPC